MSGGEWYRKEHKYVRSHGAALLRSIPAQARASLRHYEVAGVLTRFKPRPPLDPHAISLPAKSFWYFVVTDWTLYVYRLDADGRSKCLEYPWLAVLSVDRFKPVQPFQFTDDDVRHDSQGIALQQMLEEGGTLRGRAGEREGGTRETAGKQRRSLVFWRSRKPEKSRQVLDAEEAMGASLILVTLETNSTLHYHMSRAWMGAHMRVALQRSGAPTAPNWFTPPISTASFKLAARGLGPAWYMGKDDYQWRRDDSDSDDARSVSEPMTPKHLVKKSGMSPHGGASPDSSSPHTIPATFSGSPVKNFFATTGSLSSPNRGGVGLTSASIRFGSCGLNQYGYSITATRQKLVPHRSNKLMRPTREDLCEAFHILQDLDHSLANVMGYGLLDERDAMLLREIADEASYCSSSMAREMQSAFFKSPTFLKFSVVSLQRWLETCIRLGDGTVQRALPMLHRLQAGSPERMEMLLGQQTATFRAKQLGFIEDEEHRLSNMLMDEYMNAGVSDTPSQRKYRPEYASRVGKGQPSLSDTYSSRRTAEITDEDDDDGVLDSQISSPGAFRQSSFFGAVDEDLGSPVYHSRDLSSPVSSPGGFRRSSRKTEFASRRSSVAISQSLKHGGRAMTSRPAQGRRWSFLVGRLLAVTAWQKTRLLLQLLHRILHHSEGCPHRLSWMSDKDFVRMNSNANEEDVVSRRVCTQTLVRLLFQVDTPFRGRVPVLEGTCSEKDQRARMEGPFTGMWWRTSDIDFATLDLLVGCLYDLLGLGHQAQIQSRAAHNHVLDAIIDLPTKLVYAKLSAIFTRLTSLMLDSNPPAIDFEDIPTPQEMISVVAFRTARVLEELLDTVPGAVQHLQEEFLEELKYSILQKRLPKPPKFGQDSIYFLLFRNDALYRQILRSIISPSGAISTDFLYTDERRY